MKRLWLALILSCLLAHTAQGATIEVFAAASLTDVFGAIAADFEKEHPQTTIHLTTAASGDLLDRLRHGQAADVLASADMDTMDAAISGRYATPASRVVFAGNALVMAVPAGNPADVKNLDDLSRGGVRRVGVGNPESVPAGRYAKRALSQRALWFALTSKLVLFPSVRHVLSALRDRTLDAGFVYRTDAFLAAKTVTIATTLTLSPPVTYVAAQTTASQHPEEADAFLAYLRSPKAQKQLTAFGFTLP